MQKTKIKSKLKVTSAYEPEVLPYHGFPGIMSIYFFVLGFGTQPAGVKRRLYNSVHFLSFLYHIFTDSNVTFTC